MKTAKGGLSEALVGRKARCKISHIWFDKDKLDFAELHSRALPTDEATIVAAFTAKEDGTTVLKLMLESDKGEIMECYAEHITLVKP